MILHWYNEIYRDKAWDYQKHLFAADTVFTPEPKQLNMNKVNGAFLIIICGLFLSLIVLIVELIIKRKN